MQLHLLTIMMLCHADVDASRANRLDDFLGFGRYTLGYHHFPRQSLRYHPFPWVIRVSHANGDLYDQLGDSIVLFGPLHLSYSSV